MGLLKLGITTLKSKTGFDCSMTGYSAVVGQIVGLLLFFITLGLNIVMSAVPKNFAKAVMYVYKFICSAGNWVGYLVAAIYYVVKEQGYGEVFCEYSSYSIYLIDVLSQLITLVKWDQNWDSPGLLPETYIYVIKVVIYKV